MLCKLDSLVYVGDKDPQSVIKPCRIDWNSLFSMPPQPVASCQQRRLGMSNGLDCGDGIEDVELPGIPGPGSMRAQMLEKKRWKTEEGNAPLAA